MTTNIVLIIIVGRIAEIDHVFLCRVWTSHWKHTVSYALGGHFMTECVTCRKFENVHKQDKKYEQLGTAKYRILR